MQYSEIISMALNYADRATDSSITSRMDLFLKMVESRANRFLSSQKMAGSTDVVLVENVNFYSLPTDFQSMIYLSLQSIANETIRYSLEYSATKDINETVTLANVNGLDVDLPYRYTIFGNNVRLNFLPGAQLATDYTLHFEYFQSLIPLTSTTDSNWLSNLYPDCYIFGLMVEINAFVKDPESTQLWDQRFKESLNAIQEQNTRYRWDGPQIVTRND